MQQIIPAMPGFYALYPLFEEDKSVVKYVKSPVIAWHIEVQCETMISYTSPITPADSDANGVLNPDGSVTWLDGNFENINAWLASLNKR